MKKSSDNIYDLRRVESAGTMTIEPVGELTPALSQTIHETARHAAYDGRSVEISMRRISHVSWAGLWQLASSLGEGQLGNVRFRGVLPRVRSLMNEVGFQAHRIID